jgi:hypothetical protein
LGFRIWDLAKSAVKKMARLRVAGPREQWQIEGRYQLQPAAKIGESPDRDSLRANQGLGLAIANRLILRDQLLLAYDAVFVGKQLKGEVLGLPLENIGHLTAQVLQKSLTDVEAVADVDPLTGDGEAVDS